MPTEDIQTILVGVVQPAERTQPAIERAATLARSTGASVVLFHAAYEPAASGRPFFDSARLARSRGDILQQRQRLLDKHAKPLREDGLAVSTSVVWEEPAHAAILRAAIRDNAKLIVVGAHAPRARQAPALRYTDWELLRRSARPLLIVRTRRQGKGPVVVALDPTHANDKPAALDVALARAGAALARALGGRLHVAHAIPDVAYPLGPVTVLDRRRMSATMRASMRRVLGKGRVSASRMHVLEGRAEDTLSSLVEELDAQALVLGALSRRGLQNFVVGNTAERLIHRTTCDLLIVKPPGFKVRLKRSRKESVLLPKK